jgi:hypothetical protein
MRNKCFKYVMAGLVPAIHVVVQLYHCKIVRIGVDLFGDVGKPSELLAFNRVDGRDKPGHDGADRFGCFAASP